MAVLKLTGITSFCVAGFVVQPDARGLADVPDAILTDPDFATLRGSLSEGQSIEAASGEDLASIKGKKAPGSVAPNPVAEPEAPAEAPEPAQA